MTTTTPTTYDPTTAPYAAYYHKQLRAWVRRQNKWFDMCHAVRLDPTAPYNLRAMPSKASKYHAYGHGANLARLTGRPTPHTFRDLCDLVGERCALDDRP
jgi:hypothetical protein